MIREIKIKKKTLGLIIDLNNLPEGAHPATPNEWPLQLLLMKRKKGHVVPKHMHTLTRRVISQPQEGLVVVRGSIKATIWDRKGKKAGTYTVSAGQCLFLADGAHEVEFTKNSLAFEFKTGPYIDDKIQLR